MALGIFFITSQAQVQRKTLVKIATGESLMVWESNIGMSCAGQNICLVSKGTGEEYFVYQNGVKKGPFPDAFTAQKTCNANSFEQAQAITTHYRDGNDHPQYEGGEMRYTFNNRSYGPFERLMVNVSPDRKHFMAVGSKNGQHSFMSDQTNEKIIPGWAEFFHWDDAENGLCVIKSGFDDTELINIDFSNMTEAEQIAYLNELQNKIDNSVSELFVIKLNGEMSGPFSVGEESNNNPGLSLSAQGHWVFSSGTKLIIDGIEVSDFQDEYFETNHVWLSPDAKQWAVKFYDKLLFSDGSEYPYPIMVNYCNEDPSRIEWICLESEIELVHYSRSW
jgi:hypothetical protein